MKGQSYSESHQEDLAKVQVLDGTLTHLKIGNLRSPKLLVILKYILMNGFIFTKRHYHKNCTKQVSLIMTFWIRHSCFVVFASWRKLNTNIVSRINYTCLFMRLYLLLVENNMVCTYTFSATEHLGAYICFCWFLWNPRFFLFVCPQLLYLYPFWYLVWFNLVKL